MSNASEVPGATKVHSSSPPLTLVPVLYLLFLLLFVLLLLFLSFSPKIWQVEKLLESRCVPILLEMRRGKDPCFYGGTELTFLPAHWRHRLAQGKESFGHTEDFNMPFSCVGQNGVLRLRKRKKKNHRALKYLEVIPPRPLVGVSDKEVDSGGGRDPKRLSTQDVAPFTCHLRCHGGCANRTRAFLPQ